MNQYFLPLVYSESIITVELDVTKNKNDSSKATGIDTKANDFAAMK